MSRRDAHKDDMQAFDTIYCGFFLAFFVLGAICGCTLAAECGADVLWSYWSVYLSGPQLFRFGAFAAIRFCVVFYVMRKFVFAAWLLPMAVFLRGALFCFCVSSFYLSVPLFSVPSQLIWLWLCNLILLVPMLLLGKRVVLRALEVYAHLLARC